MKIEVINVDESLKIQSLIKMNAQFNAHTWKQKINYEKKIMEQFREDKRAKVLKHLSIDNIVQNVK